MARALGLLTSMRTTAALLAALAALLLVRVAVPQADGATAAAHDALVARGPIARFLLVTAGLGSVATSGPFLAALGLFFANLVAVLVERGATAVRRAAFRPPPAAAVRAWLARPDAAAWPRPAALDATRALDALRALGYRPARVDDRCVWGARNRSAPLGFLLFHASFLVLCAGAALLFLTRSVRTVAVAEGQGADALRGTVVRRAPWPAAGPPPFVLERVDVRLEDGHPIDLAATLVPQDRALAPRVARVNAPAVWGDTTVLVEHAGIAPVLWLQDARGFTLDRVAVIASTPRGERARAPLAGGALEARVLPMPVDRHFPERGALRATAIDVEVREGDRTLFAGKLAPGRPVRVGDRWLALEELRYWAGLRVVQEDGGGLLVLGFALAVVGLAWRLLVDRREVAIAWDDATVRVAGRGELYPTLVGPELRRVRDRLEGGRPRAPGDPE